MHPTKHNRRAWNLVSETHGRDTSYGAFNHLVKAMALDHMAAIFVQQRPPGCSGCVEDVGGSVVD